MFLQKLFSSIKSVFVYPHCPWFPGPSYTPAVHLPLSSCVQTTSVFKMSVFFQPLGTTYSLNSTFIIRCSHHILAMNHDILWLHIFKISSIFLVSAPVSARKSLLCLPVKCFHVSLIICSNELASTLLKVYTTTTWPISWLQLFIYFASFTPRFTYMWF